MKPGISCEFNAVGLDDAADPTAGMHRLQDGAHGVGALLPGEVPAAGLGLGAELVTQNVVRQQAFQAIHQIVVIVSQHAGDSVDDRVGETTRGPVADGRHTVLGGSMTARPPQPSLRDGSTCTQDRCTTACLVWSST